MATSTTPANGPRPWLLVSGDFVETGGQDRANHAVATYLAARGGDVRLVAHRADPGLTSRPNVTFRRVPKILGSYLASGALLARAGREEAREVSRRGGRVIVNGGNCNWPDVNWVHYVHAAWRPGTPGGVARKLKAAISHRREAALERSIVPRARLVLANSEKTRRDLIERVLVDPAAIRTIQYGCDTQRFGAVGGDERRRAREALGWPDERPAVLFVGAMGDHRKGFDTLYEAWKSLVAEASWDARLGVVGTGASLDAWRARAAAEGLSDSIDFLGFRADVETVLAACDVLVSPTRYEAYGLNVHEALCRGLPALVSAASGVAEQFPESLSALLLPDPGDATDLATRLRGWRSRPEAFREAVAPVSERLRARSWDVAGREVVEAIEAIEAT